MHNIKYVLVIDDTPVEGLVTKKLLEIYRFANRVEVMHSGQEGLDYLQEAARSGRPLPTLIFLDFNMPQMDGCGFINEFKKLPHDAQYHSKIVGLSNALNPPEAHHFHDHEQVIAFVTKPLTEQSLDAINWKLLNLANAG